MKKKKLVIMVLGVLLAGVLSGCSGASADETTYSKIMEKGEMTFAMTGAYPQRELQLTDVWDDGTAVVLAKRYIKLNAFRHDIVECEVPIWEGFDILEGDRALLTMEEGPSHDGTGWTDEPCILIERRFKQATLYQKWWRIAAV